jgi:hypothetical protein
MKSASILIIEQLNTLLFKRFIHIFAGMIFCASIPKVTTMKNNNENQDRNQQDQQEDAKSNGGKNNTVRTSPDANDEDEIEEPETGMDMDIEDDSNELDEEDEDLAGGNDSDLTQEDFEALGPRDLSMDGGEDEQLKHRSHPVDFTADDLDVPGAELDDADENTGNEDEENNSYSVGGDNHENLEEDTSRTY